MDQIVVCLAHRANLGNRDPAVERDHRPQQDPEPTDQRRPVEELDGGFRAQHPAEQPHQVAEQNQKDPPVKE